MQFKTVMKQPVGPLRLALAAVFIFVGNGLCDGDEPKLTADALFAPTRVVKVEIRVASEDWNTLRKQRRDFVESFIPEHPPKSPFDYVQANVTIDGQRIEGVGLRKKGFLGSLNEQRPSLKIKFSEFNPAFKDNPPIDGIDRLTLNNNNQDAAGASHFLGYQFFRQSGTHACRCNAAHVTMNGKDLGIYSNVESIRKPLLKRTYGDASGGLFEGTVTDFYPHLVDRFDRKNSAAKKEPILKLTEILNADELDVARLETVLDLDAFIRFWATESLIGFWDGYTNDQNNFFMYQNPANSKLYFLPWGVDCAFSENMPLPPFFIRPQFVYTRSRLANQLYQHDGTRKKYIAQVENLLEEHWNEEKLLAELDALEARLKPINTRGPEFGRSLKRIRRFIKVRRRKLTEEIEKGFVLKQGERKVPYSAKVAQVSGRFDTQWFDETPENGKEVGSHELTVQLKDKIGNFRALGVYAHSGRKKRPQLVFDGNFENGKQVSLTVDISKEKLAAAKQPGMPIETSGMLVRGKRGWFGTVYQRATGTLTLDEVSFEDGGRVSGSLELIARELVDPNWQK